ncbi:hypothetical protein ABEF93_004657 [Exophiala dermatitidis]
MSSTNESPSTLKSAVDTATGYVQSGIAAVTGNPQDKAKAEQYKDKAATEHDLSHSAVKAGPVTVTPTGAAKDDSDRTQGKWDQTIGSAKETVGNLLGNESLKQEGRDQNAQGQGKEAKGQLNDLGKGVSDRVQGALGSAVAGLTGDRTEQEKYNEIHDQGKTRQRGVEVELDKEASAGQK